ncbi:hypothetical protein F4604DRAFT_1685957 [Suillus subluteus]|nr:hypothetical protein F4604DRAFT_1685957 [Suillus subluteus]
MADYSLVVLAKGLLLVLEVLVPCVGDGATNLPATARDRVRWQVVWWCNCKFLSSLGSPPSDVKQGDLVNEIWQNQTKRRALTDYVGSPPSLNTKYCVARRTGPLLEYTSQRRLDSKTLCQLFQKKRIQAWNEEWKNSELLKIAWADLMISYAADSLRGRRTSRSKNIEEAGPADNEQYWVKLVDITGGGMYISTS